MSSLVPTSYITCSKTTLFKGHFATLSVCLILNHKIKVFLGKGIVILHIDLFVCLCDDCSW